MARDAMGYEMGTINEAAVTAFLATVPDTATVEQIDQVAARLERMVESHNTRLWQGEKLSAATLAEMARVLRARA